MLTLGPHVRIYVAVEPVDMRKSHDGLSAVMQERLALDPLAGHLVLFVNRRKDMLKILWWDRTGHTILFRRLEWGTFQIPTVRPGATRAEIDPADLSMILEGIDLRTAVRRKRYSRAADLTAHR